MKHFHPTDATKDYLLTEILACKPYQTKIQNTNGFISVLESQLHLFCF